MIIANPLYDATFKRLLENDRAAKFLIGTILGCEVLSLVPTAQEHTEPAQGAPTVSLFRMDFAATIVTKEEGEKRVIIEMQKAKILDDVFRFRRYLGREYADSKLPIIAIYILGFPLSVDSPAFGNAPKYRDLLTNEEIRVHDLFVERLTHSSYLVQTTKIKPSLNTKLDKLLSIFEQAHFIGNGTAMKDYLLEVDDPEVKGMVDILQYVAADPETRKELEKERYYQEAMEDAFGEKDRELAKTKRDLEESMQREEEYKREAEEAKQREAEARLETEKVKQREAEVRREVEDEVRREIWEARRKIEAQKFFREAARQQKLEEAMKLRKDGMPSLEIAKLTGLSVAEIEKRWCGVL
jgi:flagellar biosynthesis GTPase FlhF